MGKKDETLLQIAIAEYLAKNHPEVEFHNDYGTGARLKPYQAKEQAEMNAHRKGWPDLFIAEPRNGYAGLFIELKRDGERLQKRNGDWASEHIAIQAERIKELLKRGYYARFTVGYNETIETIEKYLNGEPCLLVVPDPNGWCSSTSAQRGDK
nr:hypothetical protein [uncultured Dysosmobacter sp.]